MRIGIVAEGPTDHLTLEAFLSGILEGENAFQRIFPDSSRTFEGAGWQGVQRWCANNGSRLEQLMRAVTGQELSLLIVHVDCDIAADLDIECECPPPADCAAQLRDRVQGWLGGVRPFVVVATPAQNTETWVVAANDPPERVRPDLECEPLIDRVLLREGRLRTRDGRVQKAVRRYAPLAERLQAEIEAVCLCCTEARGFRDRVLGATPL